METLILYGQLFWQFFKTGLFAVGGGLATLPFLQEMSRLTHWFTTTDIADMVAVSESTPGPWASTWRPMSASKRRDLQAVPSPP